MNVPRHVFLFFGLLLGPLCGRGQSWDPETYAGYRCGLLQVHDVSMDADGISFTATLANTGREVLDLAAEHRKADILITGDASLSASGLMKEKALVAKAILRSGLRLAPGEMRPDLKFRATASDPMPAQIPDEPATGSPVEQMPAVSEEPSADGCADLVIDSLWLVGEKRNQLKVAYRLCNRGDGAACLYTDDRQDQGTGVSFYFGTSDRITRGSLFVQGVHITSGLAATLGLLGPGQSVVCEVNVDMRRHTRFHTALQCRVDTFQRIQECDETNNEFVYFLR